MFIGREKELAELERRYHNDSFECMIIYGRRRVGKTYLINEFCKGKKVIYFPAIRGSEGANLEMLSDAIMNYVSPESGTHAVYSSFQDALSEIGRFARNERIVFVIDEYPYLAKADTTIASRLQHMIDLYWKDTKLFLILCGSSVSFMEDEVLAYESPLYGRRTGQIRLLPMDYRDSGKFNENLDAVTKAEIYGITGGIPLYIEKLSVNDNLKDALLQNVFNESAYLFEEPENLLKQELREPSTYNAVIRAVAGGASKLSEIATKAGIETASCTTYVRTLIELGILKKETAFGQKEGKKSLIRIADNFFKFWYRFVPSNMSAIATGRISNSIDGNVLNYMHDYMGSVFESMCADYIMIYMDDLPFNIDAIGRWWGTDSVKKKEVEIDLIGKATEDESHGHEYIAVSCKFRNQKAGLTDFDELVEYSKVFSPDAKFYYYIFSAFGFRKDLIEASKENKVRLVSIEEMYEKSL